MAALDATFPNPNPRIGRDAKIDETFTRRVLCWNVANAARDDVHNPLATRIPLIIEAVNAVQPPVDVFIVLEANRPSQGKSWTAMAAEIEEGTGLSYIGVKSINATAMSFGKALFIRRNTVAVNAFEQRWPPFVGNLWSGDYFGNDVITFGLHPVVVELVDPVELYGADKVGAKKEPEMCTRVIRHSGITVGAVHFPMDFNARMDMSTLLHRIGDAADLIMGDFNTFPDWGGPAMLRKMTKRDALTRVPILASDPLGPMHTGVQTEVPYTFRAFPHDVIKKPAEFASQLNMDSEIVSINEDGSINVRFASTLDHVFTSSLETTMLRIKCVASAMPFSDASDHVGVIADITF